MILAGLLYFLSYLSVHDLFSWRLNFNLAKIETANYQSYGPKISFKYPSIFEIDPDPDNHYGDNYLVGIKLKTDNRTGCDIRTNGPDLDYSQTTDELADRVLSQIKEKATDFRLIQKEKFILGKRPALKTSFSFLDPIGARVRLDQIFTNNDETNYMVICGSGEYQYDFFKKDFEVLYRSVVF